MMLSGLCLTSLAIGSVAVSLEPKPFQGAVLEWLRNDGIQSQQRIHAASLIQTAFREWRWRKLAAAARAEAAAKQAAALRREEAMRQAALADSRSASRSAPPASSSPQFLTPRQLDLARAEAAAAVIAAREWVRFNTRSVLPGDLFQMIHVKHRVFVFNFFIAGLTTISENRCSHVVLGA